MKEQASFVAEPGGYRAALIGDLVGSRTSTDRLDVHQRLTATLASVAEALPALDAPAATVGDEFQAGYATVGEAVQAAFLIRLGLAPEVDIRCGIGWGTVQVLDNRTGIQDGPAWWQARDAIEIVEARSRHAGTRHSRIGYRSGPAGEGPDEAAVGAALLCRDQLLGSLATRSLRILGGLVAGRSRTEIARAEGISASAVSQRVQRDGLAVIVAASAMLREVS